MTKEKSTQIHTPGLVSDCGPSFDHVRSIDLPIPEARRRRLMQERSTNIGASKVAVIAHRQIVFGKLTKVFPFEIVTYCVQQTGGPTGVYTGGPNGRYPYSAGARPATARPARPNWPKAAAALAAAAFSAALADANVRGASRSGARIPKVKVRVKRCTFVAP
jgi:hypothetical protein